MLVTPKPDKSHIRKDDLLGNLPFAEGYRGYGRQNPWMLVFSP
jgi:hypothetical protein